MRAAPALVLVALMAASGVTAGAREHRGAPPRQAYADPSAVIAAELAFARDAQVRGQWTAFAASAAPDAVMFVPQMVWAQPWLKGRANPPAALRWEPREVWSSCDGSLVVSHGTWQRGTAGQQVGGWFTTLWQRQQGGDYKWVLDHGGDAGGSPERAPATAVDDEPAMIAAHVADCPPRQRGSMGPEDGDPGKHGKPPLPPKAKTPRDLAPLDPRGRSGAAADGTLRWEVTTTPGGGRTLTLTWTRDGAESVIRTERVADGPASG